MSVRLHVPRRLRTVRAMTERLGDQWGARDYPVLLAMARILQQRSAQLVQMDEVARLAGMSEADVDAAGRALLGASPPYLNGEVLDTFDGSGGWMVKA